MAKRSSAPPLAELYKIMLKIRLVEQKIIDLYPSDKIQSPVHLSVGQEGVSAGVCLPLRPTDHLYGTYRGHGVYIAKGGDLKKMFAELYGKDAGCARGKGGSMHLVAPEVGLMGCSAIVSSTIPVATGDALASQMQGRKRVVVSFFGDGAVDEGVFFESVNFAVLKNLPILFVCENNGYAIHSKVSDRHAQTKLYQLCSGLGLSGKRYDGDDAGLVFKTVSSAVEDIRKGGGPRLLEFMTYRRLEHVGPGMDGPAETYRVANEARRALASDPIKRAKAALVKKFKVSLKQLDAWELEIRREIEEAVQFAETSPFPAPGKLFDHLYAPAV